MAMQLNTLIPPEASGEQLSSQLVAFDHARLIRSLAGAGFQIVELSGDLALFLPHIFQPPAIADLARLQDELNLSYTVHLPLWSVEPSTPLEPVRRGSVQAVVETMQATFPLCPEVFVIHATGALAAEFYRMNISEMAKSLLLRQFQSKARESITWILEQTGIEPRKLAVETIEFPFDLTLEIAEDLDLSLCFDTGHVLVGFSGPITLDEALEASLPRLAEVHLHDGPWQGLQPNVGYGQDHRPLGEGDLDLGRFLERLEEAGFGGPIIFELQVHEALRSLEVIAEIRPNLA